jgi:hypothetical protein
MTTSEALSSWTGKGAERRAQLESALSRERSACCHASNWESMTVIEDSANRLDVVRRYRKRLASGTESAVRTNHLLVVSHRRIYFPTLQHPSFMIIEINYNRSG